MDGGKSKFLDTLETIKTARVKQRVTRTSRIKSAETWSPQEYFQNAKFSDYTTCKTKNPRAESSRARGQVSFMGGGYSLTTNHDKGRSEKHKIK